MKVPLYDSFGADYDRFVEWPGRLAYELPFIERQLEAANARRVLDAACGTGMHAVALAQRGYQLTGADLSRAMIARARENAGELGLSFVVAGFGELAEHVTPEQDAVLCLGNSIPHLLTLDALSGALLDFASVLRPGGLLLIQNRNFDAVLAGRDRWMAPQAHQEGEREWLFVRFYDFAAAGSLTFNVLTLQRDGGGAWRQQVAATQLHPWSQQELSAQLRSAGFNHLRCYGDMAGASFELHASGNLVLTAYKV